MFIYVMDEGDKDKLIARGFQLLKYNGRKVGDGAVWVFYMDKNLTFAENDIRCVVSDVLTF